MVEVVVSIEKEERRIEGGGRNRNRGLRERGGKKVRVGQGKIETDLIGEGEEVLSVV